MPFSVKLRNNRVMKCFHESTWSVCTWSVSNPPGATPGGPPASGARAPPVAASWTVGVAPWPQLLWWSAPTGGENHQWLDNTLTTTWRMSTGYLGLDRDRFLRDLECEWERERERGRHPFWDRLEDGCFVSAKRWVKKSLSIGGEITTEAGMCSKAGPTWFYGSSNGGLRFSHPLHHTFQLLCSSLWGQLRGFYYGIIGMIHPERQMALHHETSTERPHSNTKLQRRLFKFIFPAAGVRCRTDPTSEVGLQTWLHSRSRLGQRNLAQWTLRRRNGLVGSRLQPFAQTSRLPPA